jgi:hypothetical protein
MAFTVLFVDKDGTQVGSTGGNLGLTIDAAWDSWADMFEDPDDPDDPASVQIIENGQLVAAFAAKKGRIIVLDVEDDDGT